MSIAPSLAQIYDDLKIPADILSKYRLPDSPQAPLSELEVVDIDFDGRPFVLLRTAASAWRRMCAAAASDAVVIKPFSGFRSYVYQKKLIERQLANGRPLPEILKGTAIPGFSEHHTGRAVDVCAEDKTVLEEAFERTNSFAWLTENAGRFAFRMTYPKNNAFEIIYEPWHWCYTGA